MVTGPGARGRYLRHPFSKASSAIILGIIFLSWAALGTHEALAKNPLAHTATVNTTLRWLGVAFTHIPRNTVTAVGVLAFTAAMVGPGKLLLRIIGVRPTDWWERTALQTAVGLAGWVPLVLFVGSVVGLSRSDILVPTIAYVLPTGHLAYRSIHSRIKHGVKIADERGSQRQWTARLANPTIAVLVIVILYLAILGALGPEIQFDARWYHLGPAYHYIEAGHFYNLTAATHTPAMGLNPYQEITYTGLYSLVGQSGAHFFAFVDAALIVIAMIAFARVHYRSARLGAFAALAFMAIPIVSWSATTASNDLPIALYTLLSLHSLIRWIHEPWKWAWAYAAVSLAAFSFGVKAFGGFSLVIALLGIVLLVVVRRELHTKATAKKLAVVPVTVIIPCVAWWIREWTTTGNPIFPILNSFFHSQYWNTYAARAQAATDRHISLVQAPWGIVRSLWTTVTNPAPYHTIVGPIFLIAVPMAIALSLINKKMIRQVTVIVGIYAALWFLSWYFSGVTASRYLIAIAPLVCIFIVASIWDSFRSRAHHWIAPAVAAMIVAVISLGTLQPFLSLEKTTSAAVASGAVTYEWRYLFRGEHLKTVQLVDTAIALYADSHLNPKHTKIFDLMGLHGMYLYLTSQFYNGNGYGSPATMRQWTVTSQTAYSHFLQNRITEVAAPATTLTALSKDPVGRHLRLIYKGGGYVLLKVLRQ